jgi:predicted MFS family arabinose efflux permease
MLPRCSRELVVFVTFLAGGFCVGLPQNVVSANLSQVARAFNIPDTDKDIVLGGWMSTAFFLIGAPASVLLTSLTRSLSRKFVLVALCTIAASSSLLSAVSSAPWQLLVARGLLGAATGALQPLLACVLGELYPPAQRPAMASFVSLATGGGAVCGQILSTLLSLRLGWRWTLLGAAAACGAGTLGIAVGAQLSTVKPERLKPVLAITSDLGASSRLLLRQLRAVLSVRTVLLVYFQALFGTVPWAVLSVFLADFIVHDRGLSPDAAALLLLAFGLGAVLGGLAGGFGGSMLYRCSGPVTAILATGFVQACAAPPLLWILLYVPPEAFHGSFVGAAVAVGVAGVGGFCSAAAGPNIKALLLNTTAPETRATVFSLGYLIDSLAKGFVPVAVGLAVQGRWLGGSDGSGRGAVLAVGLCGWVASGTILAFAACTVRSDEAKAGFLPPTHVV